MALNNQRAWLVTYDIANPKRLSRLHRFIVKHAVPVQYSVFYFEGNTAQMKRLIDDISAYINIKQDDVRGYQLPERLFIDTIGSGSLPDGAKLMSAKQPALDTLLKLTKR